ncbi:hypothetical protein HZB01_04675 [Candidatus Woesearchaeota archaeon]|nr:hypothetical protein [Candidatus Woesearchaeota archaeon]
MEHDYSIYNILIGVVIILAGTLGFAISGFFNDASPAKTVATGNIQRQAQQQTPIQNSAIPMISTGNTDDGNVQIDLTPLRFNNGRFEVEIAANTHSVDLAPFDLSKITTLEYNGKTIKPVSSSPLSGHHTTGTLLFETDGEISNFVITITGIPQEETRTYIWPKKTP